MIRSFRATAGYAANLEALKDRTFVFAEEGLTVLFGQNGSGKSTVLGLMAAYSACAAPGWSTFSGDYMPMGGLRNHPYPERFGTNCRADVAWDGTPTYYSIGTPGHGQAAFHDALERGGEDADDHIRRIFRPGSSGEEGVHWLYRLETAANNPPSLARDAKFFVSGHGFMEASKVNSAWESQIHLFADYVATLPRTGPVTLLLDEPDARLSIPNQERLWNLYLPRISHGRQVIVASHSPFALKAPRIEPDYSERCLKALATITSA